MTQTERPIIEQTFFNTSIAVGTVPTPLLQQINQPSMIQAFILSNFSTNANSVFLGDQNVSLTTGIEIVTSTSVLLAIREERQLYEVQDPTLLTAQAAMCQTLNPVQIPVITWNPSNIYLIASAPTTISAMFFRSVYV